MTRRATRERRELSQRGQIQVLKSTFQKLVSIHDRLSYLMRDFDYRSSDDLAYFAVRKFRVEELESMLQLMAKENPQPRATIAQITGHVRVARDPGKTKIGTLQVLETALLARFKKGILRGWVFQKDKKTNVMDPRLVTRVEYHPPEITSGGHRSPAYTQVSMEYWSKGKVRTTSVSYHSDELGRTVDELLIEKELFTETKEMLEDYDRNAETWLKWRVMLGEQFVGNGWMVEKNDSWHHREHDAELHGTKVVVDDRCDAVETHRSSSIFDDLEDDEADDQPSDKYCRIPVEFYVWCFNLDSHRSGYVHVTHLKPYVYRPEVREKLVLKAEHEDLIDALTHDFDVLLEDVISGKSGGTTVICQGPSGTGKTLTAEVYAEVMKRPLYRVHSGQLGIDAEGVEKELKQALSNAKRWRAFLLIDECDVFLMRRGENLDLNAVCGVFLRVMEYYDGVMFLTTNRLDDIDDAILSRCLAIIRFELPGLVERKRIWKELGDTYKLDLVKKPKEVDRLAKTWECSGRDIKGLIRLSIKYAAQRTKKPVTFDDIRRLAVFRGFK